VAFGVIDQYTAHHLSRDSHEVGPVLPIDVFLIDQAQVSLVDERGGLESVVLALSPEMPSGDCAQFGVHDRH
jgi:hypothetical protein